MKSLKTTDLAIQVLLFGGGVIFSCLNTRYFIYPYFILGGWQLLSFVAHLASSKNLFFHKERQQYGKTILWLLISGAASLVLALLQVPLILIYMFGLLIVSPFLAIWYISICAREIQLMNKKALVHLK